MIGNPLSLYVCPNCGRRYSLAASGEDVPLRKEEAVAIRLLWGNPIDLYCTKCLAGPDWHNGSTADIDDS